MLNTITEIRKAFPKSNLGYREKEILFGKGSKIVVEHGYPNCIKIINTEETKSFVFTYKKQGYKDFTVVC